MCCPDLVEGDDHTTGFAKCEFCFSHNFGKQTNKQKLNHAFLSDMQTFMLKTSLGMKHFGTKLCVLHFNNKIILRTTVIQSGAALEFSSRKQEVKSFIFIKTLTF